MLDNKALAEYRKDIKFSAVLSGHTLLVDKDFMSIEYRNKFGL